ncbi:MAG: class I SAM-dependent methyltransferase [Rhodospirillales bacterium]
MNKFVPAPSKSISEFDPRCVEAADRYVKANQALKDRSAWAIRMGCTLNLFLWHLDAFQKDEDPVPLFVEAFDQASSVLENVATSGVLQGLYPTAADDGDVDYEGMVSGLFSDVWQDMTDDIYFEETYQFTRLRFEKSGVDPDELFRDKVILDAGCGSGKFSHALARFGAKKVIGIDIGERGLAFARKQQAKVDYGDRVDFRYGSTFDIPLEDESIDLVWSNGVIHHTLNYEKCVEEFYRVLKPGGTLFLHVNGCFGLYELILDKLREACADIPSPLFQMYLKLLGDNSGRIYWIMDCLFAPYEWKSKQQVIDLMDKYGFTDFRQMLRGIDSDPIEMVSRGIPYATVKYGDAQVKFLATKPA